ncbi:MAG: hypothetical protein Q6J74_08425, partial [Gloeomargarita sp. DG02_1_bins_92]
MDYVKLEDLTRGTLVRGILTNDTVTIIHIDLKQLWNYLTQYLYLPRLKDQNVLLEAVRTGVASTVWADHFAYAAGFDETKGKYLGLQVATGINPSISPQSLLVKPEVAGKQLEQQREEQAEPGESYSAPIAIQGGSDKTKVSEAPPISTP